MKNSYLYEGVAYTDFSTEFMKSLGMNDETIESVQAQGEYEASKENKANLDLASAYLVRTDWMVARKAEVGAPIPQAIGDERTRCRALLDGTFSEPSSPSL